MPRRDKISRPRERGRQPVSHPRDLYYPPQPAEIAAATALDSLTDVSLGTLADDDFLVYNSSTGRWENTQVPLAYTKVARDGFATITPRETLRFIAGSGITLGIADDAGNDETELTITNTGVSTLDGLDDTVISGPADGRILQWDSTVNGGSGGWIDVTLAGAGISEVGHTHAAGDVTSGSFADGRISQSSVTQHAGAIALSDLSDTEASPATNEILRWNGSSWVGISIGTALNGAVLNNIGNVNAPSPSDGQFLAWDSGTSKWVPSSAGGSLSSLSDTVISGPAADRILQWDTTVNSGAGGWVDLSISAAGIAGHADDNDFSGVNDFGGGVTLSEISDVNSKGHLLMQKHYGPGFSTGNSSITGTFAIKVPAVSIMHAIRVTIYEYDDTSGAVELILGGYSYTGGPSWVNTSAGAYGGYISGADAYGKYGNVRFVYDSGGEGFQILIGDSATVWNYPKVFVEDLQGHNIGAAPTIGFYEAGVNAEPTWEQTTTEYVNRSGVVKNITTSTSLPTGEVPYGTLHLIY